EAIAGDFPDEDELPSIQPTGPASWRVDGATDLHYLAQTLETSDLVANEDSFTSVAGFLLDHLGTLPETGATVETSSLRFEIIEVINRRIATVNVTRIAPTEPDASSTT